MPVYNRFLFITLLPLLMIYRAGASVQLSAPEQFAVSDNSMTIDSIPHPVWRHHSVYFFHPRDTGRHPVVLFFHGITADNPQTYAGLLRHIVSRGFGVVYVPYATLIAMTRPWETYEVLDKGIVAAVSAWRYAMDTTRAGFIGHSYGGGAAPSFAWEYIVKQGWGSRGAFVFTMAPWFSWNLTDKQLSSFPENVLFLTQVYEEDNINDHRMAIDIFNKFGTNGNRKRYLFIRSPIDDTLLHADHGVPCDNNGSDWLDTLAVFRIFDHTANAALAGRSFADDTLLAASPCSLSMGTGASGSPRTPAFIAAAPEPLFPQEHFINFWSHLHNPRNGEYYDRGVSTQHRLTKPDSRLTLANYYHLVSRRLSGRKEPALPVGDSVTARWLWHPQIGDREVIVFTGTGGGNGQPLLLFAPSLFPESYADYLGFIRQAVKSGYAVVFNHQKFTASGNEEVRLDNMISGFAIGCEQLKPLLDTTRLVVVGYGIGAAQAFGIGHHFIIEKKWGGTSSLIWSIAPARTLPATAAAQTIDNKNIRLLVTVFDDSWKQDWRFGTLLFESAGLPAERKTIMTAGERSVRRGPAPSPRMLPGGERERALFRSSVSAAWSHALSDPFFADTLINRWNEADTTIKCVKGVSDRLLHSTRLNYFFGK